MSFLLDSVLLRILILFYFFREHSDTYTVTGMPPPRSNLRPHFFPSLYVLCSHHWNTVIRSQIQFIKRFPRDPTAMDYPGFTKLLEILQRGE